MKNPIDSVHRPLTTDQRSLLSHGFLILDKPLGITSAKAVAEVKRLLKCKKIGHGGTLDPLASGVLPLAIGEATKAFDYVASSIKEYRFTVTFGEERETDDAEGKVTASTGTFPTREDLLRVVPEFIGTIMQVPPAFSALKINGERAYKMARAGEEVVLQARPIEIHDLKLISIEPCELNFPDSPPACGRGKGRGAEQSNTAACPASDSPRKRGENTPEDSLRLKTATFAVTCGKGTYVRSLARDIARKVNSLGYISMLRRTRVGKFHENKAISLDKLPEFVHNPALFEAWVPIELALDDIPAIDVNPEQATRLRHGQTVSLNKPDGKYMVLHQSQIVATGEVRQGTLRSLRVFNLT